MTVDVAHGLLLESRPALAPAWPANEPSVLDLPITVRYMRGALDGADVRAVLTPSALRRIVEATSEIWMVGDIRLTLADVQEHEYRLREWGYRDEHEQVPSPSSDFRLFRALNATYGTAQLSGIDLFVFWKIEGDAGYGAPDRADGPTPGRGAAWIDTDCLAVAEAEATFVRLVAHEIGHVLRLCHACALGGRPESPCTDPTCPNPVIDDGRLAPCRRECRRLMRADYAGTELLPYEIGRARASVRGRRAAHLNRS